MPTVKSFDVYGAEDRLRKSKDPLAKEAWTYIKLLKDALERQKDLTNKAISKIKELSKNKP